jgi:hypothetical protein
VTDAPHYYENAPHELLPPKLAGSYASLPKPVNPVVLGGEEGAMSRPSPQLI